MQLPYIDRFETIREYEKLFLSGQIDFCPSIGERCPICDGKDCYRAMAPYWRYAIELFPEFKKKRIPIARFLCRQRSLVGKANELRQTINTAVGKDINIESDEEVKNYLLSVHGIPEWVNLNKPFATSLEYVGAIQDIPRLIVRCRRLLKDAHSVDLIIESIKKDKLFPIFSQVKSKYGVVTTKQPDFFIPPYPRELTACFERKVRPFFRDPLSVINRIQALSGDKALEKDMPDGLGVNAFLNSHPTLKGIDSNSLFLSIITDMSDSKLINRFLIDRNDLERLKREIESRYEKLFSFLNKFKRNSLEKGFSEVDGKKRYWVGLKSPNIGKRRKAIQFALKWLIEGY